MQQIEVASRSLEVNLGKAAQGATAQVEALDRLKLSAEAVSKLPLDERIKAINTALKENVSVTERAAVAADLFGSRGALAIQMLNPATIEEAARQVAIFGINLSDIDAAKIEQANDAMSTFGLLSEGIGKQLTVDFKQLGKDMAGAFAPLMPVFTAIGNAFKFIGGLAIDSINLIINGIAKLVTVITYIPSIVLEVFDRAWLYMKVFGNNVAILVNEIKFNFMMGLTGIAQDFAAFVSSTAGGF